MIRLTFVAAQVRKETDLSGIGVVDSEIQWIVKAEEDVISNVHIFCGMNYI